MSFISHLNEFAYSCMFQSFRAVLIDVRSLESLNYMKVQIPKLSKHVEPNLSKRPFFIFKSFLSLIMDWLIIMAYMGRINIRRCTIPILKKT